MVLPKGYTNTCVFVGDGSITYPTVFVERAVDSVDVSKYIAMARSKGCRGLYVIYTNLGYSNTDFAIYLLSEYQSDVGDWLLMKKISGVYDLQKNPTTRRLEAGEGSALYTEHKAWTIGFWSGFNFGW